MEAALRDSDRIAGVDAVVLYVIGHGEVIDQAHRLVLADTQPKKHHGTMQCMMGSRVAPGFRVEHLVVVDACYAGSAAGEVLRKDLPLPDGVARHRQHGTHLPGLGGPSHPRGGGLCPRADGDREVGLAVPLLAIRVN